jgi:hypothetical protein
MAGGFAKDGAVQEQIDASLEDEVNRARVNRGQTTNMQGLLLRGRSALIEIVVCPLLIHKRIFCSCVCHGSAA